MAIDTFDNDSSKNNVLQMESLSGKVAVVTGASSGIGACIVRDLLAAGLVVVGMARRVERVEEMRASLAAEQQHRLHAVRCDVSDADAVANAFEEIAGQYGPVEVLVNNAGCLRTGQLCCMPTDQVLDVLQTNVMGVVNCTRHAFSAMRANNGTGHVVLINSIVGHKVPVFPGQPPALSIYPATKFALTAINEIYRQEFKALGTSVKVTSISPGLVDTELISERQKRSCAGTILQPEDVSRAVMFALLSPPHVQIYELTLKPMGDII